MFKFLVGIVVGVLISIVAAIKAVFSSDPLRASAKDAVMEITETTLYGHPRRRIAPGNRRPGRNGYINYARMTTSRSHRPPSTHQILESAGLPTRVEANEILDKLVELVERFGSASIADLCDLLGTSSSFYDRQWGWTKPDLDEVGTYPSATGTGYTLDLPRPKSIVSRPEQHI